MLRAGKWTFMQAREQTAEAAGTRWFPSPRTATRTESTTRALRHTPRLAPLLLGSPTPYSTRVDVGQGVGEAFQPHRADRTERPGLGRIGTEGGEEQSRVLATTLSPHHPRHGTRLRAGVWPSGGPRVVAMISKEQRDEYASAMERYNRAKESLGEIPPSEAKRRHEVHAEIAALEATMEALIPTKTVPD
jgi:hypothetical protein